MSSDITKHYIYLAKDGNGNIPLQIDDEQYISSQYGVELKKEIPLSSSISTYYFEDHSSLEEQEIIGKRRKIHALKNTLDRNSSISQHFKTSSSLGNKLKQPLSLISIPSIFYGSSIEKGSVELSINYSGSNVAKLQDYKNNGELIEVIGTNTGSVAGVVLYDYGFIILTGSWDEGNYGVPWNMFGTSSSEVSEQISFDINFNGTNEINTITMLLHAEKGELNHSNNMTAVEYGQELNAIVTKNSYNENDQMLIKNVTKYKYDNFIGKFEKEVYISKIGIYDESKKLIAVAKLAKPVKKTNDREFTFKLKIDI